MSPRVDRSRNALSTLAGLFRSPVSGETRRLLAVAWQQLPQRFRTGNQFLGRQYAGCGATIGAMPRCDFACRGCYLGAAANRTPAQPVDEIKAQLRRLRAWLGEGGNVQLTDGEVTLRPESELIELVRFARAVGLVPMLMTHGDAFRRQPGLLERLMVEGGLSELSIHVDTTQRGRRGPAYRDARREADLLPLREEFARMIRRARRQTGQALDVATTMTVTSHNLAEVPLIIRWMCDNADAFKMISFLPVASVGRTEPGLGGAVDVEDLWANIAQGLPGHVEAARALLRGQGWLGHPACSRFVQGLVVDRPGHAPEFHPLFRPDDPRDAAAVHEGMARFGGFTTRLDTRAEAVARLAGLVAHAPGFFAGKVVPFVLRWPRRLDPEHPVRFLWHWLRGEVRVNYLNIVSHHFMSREELLTPLGRERLGLCAFRVPIGERLVSMCEVNALGVRDHYYEQLRRSGRRGSGHHPARASLARRRASVAAQRGREPEAARPAARSAG
jgi:Radical SAM superfamily